MKQCTKKIILVGMPCSGKTSVCKLSENFISKNCIDLDNFIIQHYGFPSIRFIFENYGESYFRKIEEKALKKLSAQNQDVVISSGGGVVISQKNRELFRKEFITVYLSQEKETIKKRLYQDKTRPASLKHNIEKIFQQRIPLYNEVSDIKINCIKMKPKEIANNIISQVTIKYPK